MKKLLATAIVLGVSTAAMAQPSPFEAFPRAYHVGEASCTFSVPGDLPGQFSYYGVPVNDGNVGHSSMCNIIVDAVNNHRALGWGVFTPGQTVPCDPNFCLNTGSVAVRVSNFIPVFE